MINEKKLVDCYRCINWGHRAQPCPHCNDTLKVVDPQQVLCNMCGKCARPLNTENEQYTHGLEEVHVTGGYDSYHLLDLHEYIFTFCEECLRKLFIQCKIKPEIFDVSGTIPISWEDDQKSYEYKLWKDSGGYHQAFLNKKCNTTIDCPNDAKYTILYSREDNFSEDTCCEDHKKDRAWSVNARFVPFISNTLKPFL